MEQVLVFPEKLFLDAGPFQGIVKYDDKYLKKVLDPAHLRYMDRAAAEVDPTWKQVIPYSIIEWRTSCRSLYYKYERTKKGNDPRLHNLWSIGIGGHINPVDGDTSSDTSYANAFQRELREEVELLGNVTISNLGMIYDGSTVVGTVHFGVAHKITLHCGGYVKTVDPALTNGEFCDKDYLMKNLSYFESWSQFIIKDLL
jgi:predicted NUDIX family phosphoesterase